MPNIWELNSILLGHTTRFFQAATLTLHRWKDPDEALLSSAMNISSNMLWARSSFEAADRAQEQSMAYAGAFMGSVVERALEGMAGTGERAARILVELERQLRDHHDDILEVLQQRLATADMADAGPGRVNRAAWEIMFPRFPYDSSLPELCLQIQATLQGDGEHQAEANA